MPQRSCQFSEVISGPSYFRPRETGPVSVEIIRIRLALAPTRVTSRDAIPLAPESVTGDDFWIWMIPSADFLRM